MASFEGISLEFSNQNSIRTFLSSVGGFSQSARKQIRSLQDLLHTIQRLKLTRIDGLDLEHVQYVGEGVSYKVSRSVHRRTKATFAVKHVKLPSIREESKSFERQVACVLRDVVVRTGNPGVNSVGCTGLTLSSNQVMSCLSDHNNILNIWGYGWNTLASGDIPFLVTEFAEAGTLRSFLRHNKISLQEKVVLARDVAQGLHALHDCGIAHGDLKLDNVLVTPWNKEGDLTRERFARSFKVKACISDFGHSLNLLDGNDDIPGGQRYGGTPAYNAPEISPGHGKEASALNYRKCDVWSLGLLVWETLRDGHAFHHHQKVQQAISHQSRSPNSVDPTSPVGSPGSKQSNATLAPSQDSLATLVEDLEVIAPRLASIACNDVFSMNFSPGIAEKLCKMFQMTLSVSIEEREAKVSLLPLLFRSSSPSGSGMSASILQPSEQSAWSFEIFRRAPSLPHEVKARILADCQRIATEPGSSIWSAKAAFQAALACISGFGGSQDTSEALHWATLAASKGLALACIFLPFFEKHANVTPAVLQDGCTQIFQQVWRSSPAHNPEYQSDLEAWNAGYIGRLSSTPLGPITESGHGLTDQFQLACRLGDIDLALELSKITDRINRDRWGTFPIHWLFMFPPDSADSAAKVLANLNYNAQNFGSVVNDMTKSFVIIDPQLPLRLSGTPLAFATTVGSVSAVRALLNLGADPLVGKSSDELDRSAWSIACKYHLTEIMDLFLDKIRLVPLDNYTSKYGFSLEEIVHALDLFDQSAKAFSDVTCTERTFFHGRHTAEAARHTALMLIERFVPYLEAEASIQLAGLEVRDDPRAELLRTRRECGHGQNVHSDINKTIRAMARNELVKRLCLPAVDSGDEGAVRTALEAVCQYEHHSKLKDAMNAILLRCTSAACSGKFSPESSRRLLQACLDAGADINCEDELFKVDKPVNIAIENHSVDIFEWLIENGASLHVRDGNGNSPLHCAISSRFSTVMALHRLIALGASMEAKNRKGSTPMEQAITLRRTEDITTLLDCQKERTIPNYSSYLGVAASAYQADIVLLLLGHAMSNSQFTDLDLTPALVIATRNGCVKVVEILVSHGANASKPYQSSCSCLHLAVLSANLEMVKVLLQANNLDINKRCHERTALELAITRSVNHECAGMLVDAGADVNLPGPNGESIFELLLEQPRTRGWKSLAEKVLSRSTSSYILMFKAALPNNDLELALILAKSGALLQEVSDLNDHYVLHTVASSCWYACGKNSFKSYDIIFDLVMKLIEAGADPYRWDVSGKTPLEAAVVADNGAVCLALIHFMAPTIQNSNQSPQRYPLGAQVIIKRAWDRAIQSEALACICAFHRAGIKGDITMLSIESGCKLLQYALENEIGQTLVLFMGSSGGFQDWDSHLHRIWKIVMRHTRRGRSYSKVKNAVALLDSSKVPKSVFDHQIRLKALADGYTPKLNSEYIIEKNYCEAQGEADFKQIVLIDSGVNHERPDTDDEWDFLLKEDFIVDTLYTEIDEEVMVQLRKLYFSR